MNTKIGKLDFEGCAECVFNDGPERCSVDLQEVVDNLHVENGMDVCCGCFIAKATEGGAE